MKKIFLALLFVPLLGFSQPISELDTLSPPYPYYMKLHVQDSGASWWADKQILWSELLQNIQDSTSGGGTYLDTLYVSYCGGCGGLSGWKYNGDTIYVDTSSTVTDTTYIYQRLAEKQAYTDTLRGRYDATYFYVDSLYGSKVNYWTKTGDFVHLVTATDSVGIGTDSPTERFEVGGQRFGNYSHYISVFSDSDDTHGYKIKYLANGGSDIITAFKMQWSPYKRIDMQASNTGRGPIDIMLGNSTDTSAIYINKFGNVGIGGNYNNEKLQVNGNIKAEIFKGDLYTDTIVSLSGNSLYIADSVY